MLYRRMTALVLGGAALLASSWPNTMSTAAAAPRFKVTLVTPFISYSPDWSAVNVGFKKAVAALGGQATVVGPNQLDLTTMVEDILSAATTGTQGVATWVGDTKIFAPAFAALEKNHIPLVTIQGDAAKASQRIGFVTDDLSALATLAAKRIIAKTHGNAHVGIIASGPADENQMAEIAQFKKVLSTSKGSSVVTVQYDNSDASKAATEAAAMITAHPDLNVMWTTEGAAAPAMDAAVRDAHDVGKVLVVGVNLWPQDKQALQNGSMWGTFVQHFHWMGRAAGTMLMDHLLHRPYQQPAHSEAGPFKKHEVIFPVSFVTKANLATAGGD